MLLKEAALHSVGHLTSVRKGWNADSVTVLLREAPLHRPGLLAPQWSVRPTWRSGNKEKMAARSRREQQEVEITVKDELSRDGRMREQRWRWRGSSQCWTLNILKFKIRNGLITKISENLKLRSQICYNAHNHTHTYTRQHLGLLEQLSQPEESRDISKKDDVICKVLHQTSTKTKRPC